ncbi:hypothetical protein BU26DRAFT_116886 [Trematosphaeria pertusa]|uniref:Mid2 domain-containing protein n=1 Tax=Trematosphaeria pertusa TaxID=390896 RepID=A0A6A6HZ77_9PLEO|nr:uncharacterized protein BU26DRAFT_116886 [Trematosphaeria pertusa]KAF2243371.1 hypothetical protein BU26DRAFT_116886 [Trematosphaeria pertusa]
MQRLLFMLSLSIASATFASLCGAHGVSGPDNAKRQVASTISYDPYSTWAYTAGEPSDGTVIWAPLTYYASDYSLMTSSKYYTICPDSTYLSSISSYMFTCSKLWTACTSGYLVAESTSSFCLSAGYTCFTSLLFPSYGASEAVTKLGCATHPDETVSTIFSIYQERPPPTILAADLTSTASTSTPSASPASSLATSTATSTSSASAHSSSKPNRTGIIAGSVVAGVAVLVMGSLGVLYVLRRTRRNNASAPPGMGPNQAEKMENPDTLPEWSPTTPQPIPVS